MVLGFQPKLARRRIVSPFDPLANNTVAIEKDKESGSTTLILRVSTRTCPRFARAAPSTGLLGFAMDSPLEEERFEPSVPP